MPWHNLVYHDVNWEEGPGLRGIGGTCTPDVFRAHVEAARAAGEVVSPDEAVRRLAAEPDARLISFWFDDGLAGVRRHALPILAEKGLHAAAAVCSRFYRRSEMFWRFQLAHLHAAGALELLRQELARLGHAGPGRLRDLVMDEFGDDVLDAVDRAYARSVAEPERRDAFRAFMTLDDVSALAREGWTISNHTAAHHHVGHERGLERLGAQFQECEDALRADLGTGSRFWVLPFDRDRSDRLVDRFQALDGERWLVLCGDRPTRAADLAGRVIHRFVVPTGWSGPRLGKALKGS